VEKETNGTGENADFVEVGRPQPRVVVFGHSASENSSNGSAKIVRLLGQALDELFEHVVELVRVVHEQGVAVAVETFQAQLVAEFRF
jgi:hypothetical protein